MTNIEVGQRKPGRPRAISEDLIDEVVIWYQSGLGYRSITRELEKYGVCVDWTTVRRAIKRRLGDKDHYIGFYSNSATILPRGLSEE
jgi:transposase-like protein